MPKYRKVTKTTVERVLRRMADQCKNEPEEWAEVYAQELNRMLSDLCDQDFFGTEGQLDPRGDHRDVDC